MNIGHKHQPNGASVVYWIHKPEHTDIFTQGYVGITNGKARERWAEHRRSSRKNPDVHCVVINYAIRKHRDLIYEVVVVADTREYCERIEGLLRPTNNIGYNIARGGMPVDTMMGGVANRKRWIQHWIDNPTEAANRWWDTERALLNKQAIVHRRASKPKPFTKDRKPHKDSNSGSIGVTWFTKYSKWRAQIGISPIVITLGYFDTKEQAQDAYLQAKAIYKSHKQGNIELHQAIRQIKGDNSGLLF
jgi:hypothetical protein